MDTVETVVVPGLEVVAGLEGAGDETVGASVGTVDGCALVFQVAVVGHGVVATAGLGRL